MASCPHKRTGSDVDQSKRVTRSAASGHARNPFSIAFLFYLVTLAAILSACLRTLLGESAVTVPLLARMIVVGVTMGLFVGGLAGGSYFKGWKAIWLGMIVGAAVGAVAGSLTLIQHAHFWEIVWIAFFGCWIMIVVILLAARFQSQTPL